MDTYKKFILIICLVTGIIPGLIFEAAASPGRMYGLGLTNDSSAWMLSAEESYFIDNPAILQKLVPEIWVELADLQAGLYLNPIANMSLYILTGIPVTLTDFPGASNTPPLNEELLRLGLGFSLGNLDLGLSAGVATTSGSVGTTQNHSNTVVNSNVGAIYTFSEYMSIDAAGGFTAWVLELLYPETPANNYTATDYDFYGLCRLNWELISQNMFHIYGKFNKTDRSFTIGETATANITNYLTIGISDEFQLTENILILTGAYFYGNLGGTSTDHTYSVTGNVGAEISFTNKFTGRVGVSKTFWNQAYTDASSTISNDDGTTAITCGLGLKLGDFLLDMNINRTFFVSSIINPLSSQISLTYLLDNIETKK